MPTYTALTGDQPVIADPALYGGKGQGLLSMAGAGLPVPQALVLTTDTFKHYRSTGHLPTQVHNTIMAFCNEYPDSMFSVRSGAPVSMPGMMDTVLNVGVTDALDAEYPGAFRRYTTSWLSIVHGIDKDRINELCDAVNLRSQGYFDKFRKLLRGVVQASENVAIPEDRIDQVLACVKAVFDSWDTPRAKVYREMHGIPDDMGTACVVQRMVMGTAGGFSGSGVMFSRNPATGDDVLTGEFAAQAQGEEVVSGEITPKNITELPLSVQNELQYLADKLEVTYGDVQDIEFTYESGQLFVLQTRVAKMSARARIITACDLAETLHHDADAQLDYLKRRVDRGMLAKCRVPVVKTDLEPDATGLAASPGAISGKVVFRHTPLSQVTKGCILVAEDTQPEDFPIMAKAGAIFTALGGFTCHSAVVARGIGVPAVVGCEGLKCGGAILSTINGVPITEGSVITLDGTTGQVWVGEHAVEAAEAPRCLMELLHKIVEANGVDIPENTYYINSGLGQRVVLPMDPTDPVSIERQLKRYKKFSDMGKRVAFSFDLQGVGEDLFQPSVQSIFATLQEHYGPDLYGATILYGVPNNLKEAVADLLQVKINYAITSVLDLLDLLEA